MKLPISFGILSMGSPLTLKNTLQSYVDSKLFNLSDDVSIFFQNVTEEDLNIASEYNINSVISSSGNIGIGKALTALCQKAKNKYWMGLENDWENIHDPYLTTSRVTAGIHLLESGKADAIRFRSRRYPGSPLYTTTYMGREMDSPMHLIECAFWRENPDVDFPEYIQKDIDTGFYIADSKYANFTNNPTLYSSQFYIDNVSPFSGNLIDLEGKIETFWKEGNFKVAMGEGLFCHTRLDR